MPRCIKPLAASRPEQAAANHHRMRMPGGRIDHVLRVGNVAVAENAVQLRAGQGGQKRRGASGQQQAVVGGLRAIVGGDDASCAVNRHHLLAQMQGDALRGIPAQRVEDDLVNRLFTRQHRRQQDAVVVGMRLGAKNGDLVQIRRHLEQLLQRADTGHAVAHHHQLHLRHARAPSADMDIVVRNTKHETDQLCEPFWGKKAPSMPTRDPYRVARHPEDQAQSRQ
jgi:hypothetical protein